MYILLMIFLCDLLLLCLLPLNLHLLLVDDMISHFGVERFLEAVLGATVVGAGLVVVGERVVHRLK